MAKKEAWQNPNVGQQLKGHQDKALEHGNKAREHLALAKTARESGDHKAAAIHDKLFDAHHDAAMAHAQAGVFADKHYVKTAEMKTAAADKVHASASKELAAHESKGFAKKPAGEKGALQSGAKGGQFYVSAKGTKIYVK